MFNIFDYVSTVKKLFTRTDFLILFGLIGLFLITRLFNLDKFPIFSDEGIYVHWAKVAWRDANWRFISLTDGRQPLQTWGTIPFLKLFTSNALLAGRLFSVATGFFALTGLVSLCTYLFNKRTAYIAALLYIFVPYFLFLIGWLLLIQPLTDLLYGYSFYQLFWPEREDLMLPLS